ncbi:hypothetical protein SVIOM74S_07925 [Streptomyces violarus]
MRVLGLHAGGAQQHPFRTGHASESRAPGRGRRIPDASGPPSRRRAPGAALERLPELLTRQSGPRLTAGADGTTIADPQAVLVQQQPVPHGRPVRLRPARTARLREAGRARRPRRQCRGSGRTPAGPAPGLRATARRAGTGGGGTGRGWHDGGFVAATRTTHHSTVLTGAARFLTGVGRFRTGVRRHAAPQARRAPRGRARRHHPHRHRRAAPAAPAVARRRRPKPPSSAPLVGAGLPLVWRRSRPGLVLAATAVCYLTGELLDPFGDNAQSVFLACY